MRMACSTTATTTTSTITTATAAATTTTTASLTMPSRTFFHSSRVAFMAHNKVSTHTQRRQLKLDIRQWHSSVENIWYQFRLEEWIDKFHHKETSTYYLLQAYTAILDSWGISIDDPQVRTYSLFLKLWIEREGKAVSLVSNELFTQLNEFGQFVEDTGSLLTMTKVDHVCQSIRSTLLWYCVSLYEMCCQPQDIEFVQRYQRLIDYAHPTVMREMDCLLNLTQTIQLRTASLYKGLQCSLELMETLQGLYRASTIVQQLVILWLEEEEHYMENLQDEMKHTQSELVEYKNEIEQLEKQQVDLQLEMATLERRLHIHQSNVMDSKRHTPQRRYNYNGRNKLSKTSLALSAEEKINLTKPANGMYDVGEDDVMKRKEAKLADKRQLLGKVKSQLSKYNSRYERATIKYKDLQLLKKYKNSPAIIKELKEQHGKLRSDLKGLNPLDRAFDFVSERIAGQWKELYLCLPMHPDRSVEQRQRDIEILDSMSIRKDITSPDLALLSLKKWRLFHHRCNLSDLMWALRRAKMKALAQTVSMNFSEDSNRDWRIQNPEFDSKFATLSTTLPSIVPTSRRERINAMKENKNATASSTSPDKESKSPKSLSEDAKFNTEQLPAITKEGTQ